MTYCELYHLIFFMNFSITSVLIEINRGDAQMDGFASSDRIANFWHFHYNKRETKAVTFMVYLHLLQTFFISLKEVCN